jgi:glutathione S-transferase
VLGYLDAHLKHHTYVAGDDLTMGDIPMGCAIWRWFGLQIERPELPYLQRWFDSLRQRPAYQNIVMLPVT